MMRIGVVLLLLVPAALAGQQAPPQKAPPQKTPPQKTPPQQKPPVYRGFTPGMSYRTFAERARRVATGDGLRCKTSANTAQLMECGAMIRDSSDGARFYLSGYIIEGKVAMVSFGDSGDARLLAGTREDLLRRFGPARSYPTKLEWKTGPRVAAFTWRGRGAARWFYINLRDDVLLKGTSAYAKRAKS